MRAAIRQQANSSPRNHSEQVLETKLDLLQQRILETAKGQFLFYLTAAAREFLLLKGTEQRYGAERLKLPIERHIVYPLANLLATDQIHVGDMVCIDRDHNQPCLNFIREVTSCNCLRKKYAGAVSLVPPGPTAESSLALCVTQRRVRFRNCSKACFANGGRRP
jgi:C-terminal, D2-small domain, of ClpB protein